jgi:hypothetical protein
LHMQQNYSIKNPPLSQAESVTKSVIQAGKKVFFREIIVEEAKAMRLVFDCKNKSIAYTCAITKNRRLIFSEQQNEFDGMVSQV